ncbi:hypothetical protein LINPERHAP1_LOCUS27784 [Linum perenne]
MSRFGWAEPLVDRTPEAARPQPSDVLFLSDVLLHIDVS